MPCPLSLLGTSGCDAINNTDFDLGTEFGMCNATVPIYVPTSNDNIMVRLHDGRLVQVVQTIKLNCPPQSPPACDYGEDREQVSYVVRASDDCGQNWTPSVLDATDVTDLNGNPLSPLWRGFDRVEVYADPWSDHMLLTSQPGPNECRDASETAFLHASTSGGAMTFVWEQLFKHAPNSVPTVMTTQPHTGGTSRVYWFNCENWKPTLFFADDPWNGGAPQIHKLDSLLQQTEGNQTTSETDFECMLLPSALNLCEPGSSHPNCARIVTTMGQGIHWECVADAAHTDACPPGTTAETQIRNLIFNAAISRIRTDGVNDVIRVAYPQSVFTQNKYYQTLRIVDIDISQDGSGGFVVTPQTNRVIDAATNQVSPASVFYPSIIQVDQTTIDDPTASTHMLRWTEFDNNGNADEMLTTWDTAKSWVGSSICPQYGACPITTLWNPDEDIDTWACSGNCSPGDYQYGAFIDTLDQCTHRFFVPWGAQNATSGIKTHGAIVRTTTDNVPPVFDSSPVGETVSCESVPPPPTLTASDNCDASVEVALGTHDREDGSCPDNYTLTRTWTAIDNVGLEASETQTIEVEDSSAPVLDTPPSDQTVECDSVPGPGMLGAMDNCDDDPMISFMQNRVDGSCPSNYELTRTWDAEDRCGNQSSSISQMITVQDTTAPDVASDGEDLYCLWPANHKDVCFTQDQFSPEITDNCGTLQTWRFAGCAPDQPDDAEGDGKTFEDCKVSPDGQSFCVRAERDGSVEAGRRYAVSIVAIDECGNTSAPVVIGNIHVPHDQKEKEMCIH
jgi:hypothetical protein